MKCNIGDTQASAKEAWNKPIISATLPLRCLPTWVSFWLWFVILEHPKIVSKGITEPWFSIYKNWALTRLTGFLISCLRTFNLWNVINPKAVCKSLNQMIMIGGLLHLHDRQLPVVWFQMLHFLTPPWAICKMAWCASLSVLSVSLSALTLFPSWILAVLPILTYRVMCGHFWSIHGVRPENGQQRDNGRRHFLKMEPVSSRGAFPSNLYVNLTYMHVLQIWASKS